MFGQIILIHACFKKIVYFVFIFKIMYSFSKYEYRIKNPFSHLSLFVTWFENKIHPYTRLALVPYFWKQLFFTYLSDMSETSRRGGAEHFQFYKENGIIFILAENEMMKICIHFLFLEPFFSIKNENEKWKRNWICFSLMSSRKNRKWKQNTSWIELNQTADLSKTDFYFNLILIARIPLTTQVYVGENT